MSRLTNEIFTKAILETGEYHTPEERKSHHPKGPSWWYALRYTNNIFGIVARAVFRAHSTGFGYKQWQRIAFRALAFAEHIGSDVSVEGFNQLKNYGKPVVFVSNHMSTLETMAVPPVLLLFGDLSIVLKKSLDDMPFFGRTARLVHTIAVSRTNPREDLKTVLTVGCKRIEQGLSVLLFPQGTRQAVFHGHKFNSLGAKLAFRAGVPVVPIAVRTDLMQTGKWIRDFGPVDPSKPLKIKCGPIIPSSLGAREMHAQSLAFIEETLRGWGLPVLAEE